MKSTNTLKINKLTKTDYTNDVLPAFIAYRKQMQKSCGVYPSQYLHLYTERRAYGLRSKYWASSNELSLTAIQAYIQKNPITTTANGKILSIEARYVRGNVYYTQRPDVAIFCKVIN
jgi:hypothetical protein